MSIRQELNGVLRFKCSMIGFALNCDIAFTNRVPALNNELTNVHNLKKGDKIFISTGETNINLNELVRILLKNNIQVWFYIMYEPIINKYIIELLEQVAIGFYIQNNIYDDPKIHCMPIGIRDCENIVPGHKGFSHDYLYNQSNKTIVKEYLCLLCYSYSHDERYRCYNALSKMPYITNLNDGEYERQPSIHCGKVPVWLFYEYMHKSYYTLSPRGCGEDCHRFYEAIYLDSIPIVKRTNSVFDKLYDIFPCLVVNDWSDITETLLIENKELLTTKLISFKSKYPDFLTNMETVHALALQT